MEFVHLNTQTSKGSFLESSIRIKEYIKKNKDNGFNSIGIADKTFFSSAVFYDECTKEGIKPILGICKDIGGYNLTFYAKNFNGYKSLVKFCNNGEGEYPTDCICVIPRIDGELYHMLFHANSSNDIIDGFVNKLKKCYNDDLYIEITDNNLRYESDVNELLIKCAKRNKVEVLLSGNIKYLNKEDRPIHDILSRIKYNVRNDNKRLDGDNYHFREINEFKQEYIEYLKNSVSIDNKIESFSIYENDGKFFMHNFDDDKNLLYNICKTELVNKNVDSEEYNIRLDYELSVINKEGFASYFLLVADVVDWCNSQGILVGVGRGSAGGSLVAYLTGITGFDPMHVNCPLYFERFLNPARVSPPDIDVDITDRNKVIDYVKEKYGSDRVVNIGTAHTLGTRASLANVARLYNVNDKELKPLYNLLPIDSSKFTNETMYEENEEYRKIINSNALLRNIWQYAIRIEGLFINAGVHASGVIISPRDMNIPTNISNGITYSELDMHDIENQGYIKFDFLGLNTLKIIEKTVEKIRENKEPDFDIRNIYHWDFDKKTYDLINSGKTTCVFQWESDGYKNLIRRLKPDDFNELIDLNTLYRPGPMESGMTDLYIDRKFGKEEITYPIPELEPYLKRKGLPLFQEEIMKMCEIMAGFSLSEADMIRKAIGKKKKEDMDKMKEKFIDGCIKTSQFTKDKAVEEWEKLEKFQRYSWNLSHGLAYTIISYWTAYLSANFPAEFFAANMDTKIDDHDRMSIIINEVKSRGIKILPPDINKATYSHTVINDNIYMTLDSIKGIGEKAKEAIIKERNDNGDYKGFHNFAGRINKQLCNSSAKEALIYSGVFDSFYLKDKETPFSIRYKLLDKIINKKNENKKNALESLNPLKTILMESNFLGLYINNTPIDLLKLTIYTCNISSFEVISVHKHIDKRGNLMAFVSATDYKDKYEFVVFSKAYDKFKDYLKAGSILIISFSPQRSNKSCVINQILPVYIDDKINNEYKKFMKPVVSLKSELSNNFDFERYIANKDNNGKVALYKKDGINKFYPINKIIGYK